MINKIFIIIAVTIAANFKNIDANPQQQSDCIQQLMGIGKFTLSHTKTDAFIHAYNMLIVDTENEKFSQARAILYDYQNYLYNEAFTFFNNNHLQEPLFWCALNIQIYSINIKDNEIQKTCAAKMKKAGYTATAKDALYLCYYKYKKVSKITVIGQGYFNYIRNTIGKWMVYSKAKTPKEYCYEMDSTLNSNYESPISTQRYPVEQSKHQNLNLKKPSALKTSNLNFDLNELPPEED